MSGPGALTDLSDDFERAGLAGRLAPGARPALIVVDPAVAYTDPASPLYAGVAEPVRRMREVLAAARAAEVPVVVSRVVHEHPGDGGLFARKVPATRCFAAGHRWGEFIDGLAPTVGEVLLTKQYPSAFFGTALAATLTAWGIDTLVITGLTTSGCVRATALDALQHGFVPLVVREAVGDRHAEPHESNLRDIAAKAGEVTGIEEALAYLAAARPGRSV